MSDLYGTGSPLAENAAGEPFLPYAQVQAFLGLDGTENAAVVAQAIAAASQGVIDFLAWDPREQTSTEIRNGTGAPSLVMKRKWITSVSAVSLLRAGGGWIAQDTTNVTFEDESNVIYDLRPFPRGQRNIQVIYTSGFATLPQAINTATMYTIKAMVDASGVDFNATGESFSGVLSQTFNAGGPGIVPPAAKSLLLRYKREI